MIPWWMVLLFPLLLFPMLASGLPGQWWRVSLLTLWDGLHEGEQVMSFFSTRDLLKFNTDLL